MLTDPSACGVQSSSTQGAPGYALMGEESSDAQTWQAWPTFISSQRATGTLVNLHPNLGNPKFSTLEALELLRKRVYDLASYQTRNTKKVYYRHGFLLPRKKKEGNRLLMAPISFTSSKGSNKYRPVWIARLSALKAAAARGDYLQMLCLGVRASVVAQPYMGRMVRILSGIDSLPEDA